MRRRKMELDLRIRAVKDCPRKLTIPSTTGTCCFESCFDIAPCYSFLIIHALYFPLGDTSILFLSLQLQTQVELHDHLITQESTTTLRYRPGKPRFQCQNDSRYRSSSSRSLLSLPNPFVLQTLTINRQLIPLVLKVLNIRRLVIANP